jgi:hypothetical protein
MTLRAGYLLFAVQTLLASTGRRDIHRQVGVADIAVAVAVVATYARGDRPERPSSRQRPSLSPDAVATRRLMFAVSR